MLWVKIISIDRMDARGGKCHQIWRGHRAIFEFFLKLPTTVEELKRGVPAKKETMKKHDLAFAERSPNGARLKPDASDVNDIRSEPGNTRLS